MKKKNSGGFGAFIMEHKQYAAVAGLFVILVIVLIVFGIFRGKSSDSSSEKTKTEEGDSVGSGPIEVPEDAKLEQNAYEDINAFFTKYYQAMASGDTDTLTEMGNVMDDESIATTKIKAQYYEDYENMSCYTKPGPEKDSYIVFVYYEIKVNNIDTLAPGLSTFYLCTADDGSYYVKNIKTLPKNMQDYVNAIANQSDVQNLLSEVEKLYNMNTESDPTLAAFMDSLNKRVKTEAARVRAEGLGSLDEGESTVAAAEVSVKTTTAVKIRSGPSTDSSQVATAAAGDTFTRISEEGEWSKIRYGDGEAYIKSEFLSTAEGNTVVSGEVQTSEPDTGAAGGNSGGNNSGNNNSSSSGGTITVNEAASIRASASTDGQKLGSAYKGARYTLLGEENGWYKINYDGRTGYIRNDLASKN